MAGELQALRLRQVVTELRKLDQLLNDEKRHTSFMRFSIKQFDARDMLQLSTELWKQIPAFELRLSELAGRGKSITATIGNRPPQEIAPGRFTPSQGGELAEFRALSSKLPPRLDSLAREVALFNNEADSRLKNDPGRYGDASVPSPINDLLGFLQNVLDLIKRINGL